MAAIERAAVDKSQLDGKTIVWVMGGPGSGRGTQCEKVCLKHGDFVHISSGDLMKAEVMSGSARGAKLYQLMSSGEAVPNEIVTDILAEAMIRKAGGSKGFLIDGYPGDEAQAMVFVEFIAKPSIVICLEVSDQVMLQRLKSRGNFDDQPDAIAKRVAKWNDKTKPIAAAYNAFVINAERTANEIFADIEKAIS